jgi:beta-N-acetylglucosaminidase
MSQQNSQMQQIKNMANMLKGSKNPQQMLQMAAQQNPQVSQVMNMLSGSGMSAKDMFYNIAKQRGINPDDVINNLK